MIEYSIEIYKSDKRMKAGKKLVQIIEFQAVNINDADEIAKEKMKGKGEKFSYELHQTYREVRNIMSGKIVKEHYKTPYCCSVGSETYFSM